VYTGWARTALRLVGSTAARVALHRSARSRVTSFRERERIPGFFGGFVCEVCVSVGRCENLLL
jgi:hypothetical protein